MGREIKSSASKGTRKKHAAKKAGKEAEGDQQQPSKAKVTKGPDGKKLSKAQRKALPKVKQYIPPPKPPAPPIPDPLDAQGLSRTLPADLVVVLRRLGKKDDVTRRKGLDELREQWVARLGRKPVDNDDEIAQELAEVAVLAAIPVWLHNLASLLQSPFHRAAALALQDDMIAIPPLRGAILDALSMGYLPGTQDRDIIGSWLVAALEEGRRAGGQALKTWEKIARFGPKAAEHEGTGDDAQYTAHLDLMPHLSALAEYFSLSILDPETLHRDIHPNPVQSVYAQPTPQKGGAKGKQQAKVRPSPAPTPTPPPVEEDESVAEERWARYRVGGLVGFAWLVQQLPGAGLVAPTEEIAALLHNPVLWSALGPVSHLPDLTPIGTEPPIRRSAYNLLTKLVEAYPAEVEKPELLQLLSTTILGNCWSEKEAVVWEAAGHAIVKFLTKYPQSWLLSSANVESAAEAEADDDDEDEDEDDETEPPSRDDAATPAQELAAPSGAATPAAGLSQPSKAFDAFLEFISSISPTVPHLTYPLLVVVISTLPTTILPLTAGPGVALQNLFSHLWSPVDARLLSTHTLGAQPSAFQAFLQSAIDVTTFLLEKATNGGEHETAQWLVKGQLGSRVWGEGVAVMGAKGGRRGAPPVETEAKMTAKAVNRVVALSVGGTLTDPLLAEIKRTTLEASFPAEEDAKRPAFLSRATSALSELRTASPQIENAVDDIILQIADGCTERMFNLVGERSPAAVPQAEGLVGILTKRKDLFPPERVQVLSQGLQAHLPELVDTLSPQLLASLLDAVASASSTAEADSLRTALWKYVESDAVERPKRFALASGILGSGAAGLLSEKSLDAIAKEASRSVLQEEDSVALSIATAAVVSKGWLSDSARQDILASASTTVQDAVDGLLSEGTSAEIPAPSLAILAAYAKEHLDKLVSSQVTIHGIVAVHHLVILVPRLGLNTTVPSSAADIWKAAPGLDGKTKQVLSTAISTSLAELLGRVSCRVDPGTLVDVALATDLGVDPTPAEVAKAMLPSSTELLEHLARHTSQPPHPSLPVIDPLVPCVSETEEQVTRPSDFDASGRSRAARYAEAGLALLRADRSLVQAFPSLLHVALGAMVLAEDGIAIPGASRGLYTVDTPVSQLGQVIRDAEGALSFSLAIVDEAPLAWHKATVEQLRTGTVPDNADYLQRLLSDIRRDVVAKTSDVAPRIFREVLSRHLRQCDAGEAEGEVWLNYALQMSDRHPDIALAVILAIKPLMLDSKAFGMAQNRLANFLTGISVKQANEKGLPALRLLIASAPPLDSTSIFLPQQRAVFALRHVGGWLTSEDEAADDLADEVDVRVAELYTAVAPIVQDLAGAHWDAMFDLVEGTLTSSSLDDPVSYPLLYAGLNLLKEIRDLCQTNKSLRELWTAKDGHFGLVVNLFLQCRDANSIPVQLIHSLILDLLRDASPAVMAQAGLPELCDLLRLSSSATIQATAYRLLGQVIRKQTAALVLEVEADVAKEDEEAPQREIKIPQQLISIVEAGRAVDWFEMSDVEIVLGQLLAWMAVLDHFDDASRTVRWAYLDQINSSRLLEESLLPLLFAMLGVSELGAWNFPASQYAVDEFYPDLLEPEELADLTPLASHVFYRTLVTIPSAMRAYYESLKDRQLSLSLLAFTAKNYSPVIIQNEFAALREPRALAALTEEGLNVRIAQGGGASVAGSGAAEAIASYVVDEQPMEIGIRLPAEFPLKAVDVRDLRRVGVPENKWRGWLMSVQQTITSRNGLILEALTVFKKNVVLHFEGVVECAICYSIISLTDRTLPTKPCRTCKNRFHASCLFKWFNSSHSSSCPMCRSLF